MYDSPPSPEKWAARLSWLEKEEAAAQHPLASYMVEEHACALSMDLYSAFCSGAWISVIVLAHAVADSSLRGQDSKARSVEVFGADADLTWLRKRRNELVHARNDVPVITVDEMWMVQKTLERDARRAVQIMFRAIFSDPGT